MITRWLCLMAFVVSSAACGVDYDVVYFEVTATSRLVGAETIRVRWINRGSSNAFVVESGVLNEAGAEKIGVFVPQKAAAESVVVEAEDRGGCVVGRATAVADAKQAFVAVSLQPVVPAACSTDLSKACALKAATLCRRLIECDGGFWSKVIYRVPEDCIDAERLFCEIGTTAIGSTKAADEIGNCAKTLGALDCPALVNSLFTNAATPGCDVSALGSLSNGSVCVQGQQCRSGYCSIADGEACGTCTARAQVGQNCGNAVCETGLVCNRTCVPPQGKGDKCGTTLSCKDELVCVREAADPDNGICTMPAAPGEPCDISALGNPYCRSDSVCNPKTRICELVDIVVQEGASCGLTPSGGYALCGGGTRCRLDPVSNMPKCFLLKRLGETCDSVNQICESPSVCMRKGNDSDRVCTLPSMNHCSKRQ